MHRMKSRLRPLAVGAGTLVVLAAAALPAAAQYYYPAPRAFPPAPPHAALAPHHADAVVRSLGLRPLGPAQRHGPTFVVPAMGQEGTQVQVTLDRRTGRVLEIMQVGPAAPRMARLPAYPPRGPYEADDDGEPAGYENDEVYPPLVRGQPLARNYPEPGRGPAVITREGIQSQDLPPSGVGPRIVERDPEITGSVTRQATRGTADPLIGVPKEFRGQQQRTAARPPETGSRATPLPRPRPADLPAVAQTEKTSEPAAAPVVQEPVLTPKAKEDAEKFPPVQALE
jgi:hypothetical protein